jgi:hypothetical protein
MTANLITGHIWQVRIYCKSTDQVAINVLHYQVTAQTGTLKTDGDLAARMDAVFGPVYQPVLGSAAEYRGVGVQRISPIPPTVEVLENIQADVGGGAGDLLPRQVCGLITKRTLLAGRRYRGRAYIPFPSEGLNDTDGTPTGAYLTNLLAVANAMEAPVVVGVAPNETTLTPIIWHRATSDFDVIVECTTNDKWATQRRRGSYGRTNTSPI